MTDSMRNAPPPWLPDPLALGDIRDVTALVRLGKSFIHASVVDGTFPAPAIREPRYTRWLMAEVRAWIAARIEKSAADLEQAKTLNDRMKKASAAAQVARAKRRVPGALAVEPSTAPTPVKGLKGHSPTKLRRAAVDVGA